jgi:hypothetical protein
MRGAGTRKVLLGVGEMRGDVVGRLAAAAVLMAAAGAAHGQEAHAGPERLVMPPYPGAPWKQITDKRDPARGAWNHESIPAGQTVEGFTDIISDQGYPWLAGQDPVAFLKGLYARFPTSCDGVRVSGPFARTEGGFKVAYGQVYCGQQHGKPFGVATFYKVISGDKALYSINRDLQTPASPNGAVLTFPKGHEAEGMALLKAQSVADQYLADQVYLCGGRSSDTRCAK